MSGPCGFPSGPAATAFPGRSAADGTGRMILGRRDQPGLLRRLGGWLWPRAGWRRAGSYLLMRLRRLPGTPHAIAAGLATGVAGGLTPFLGLHLPLALALDRGRPGDRGGGRAHALPRPPPPAGP